MARLKDLKKYTNAGDLLFPQAKKGSLEDTANQAYQKVCAHARLIADQRLAHYVQNNMDYEYAKEKAGEQFNSLIRAVSIKFGASEPAARLGGVGAVDYRDVLLTQEFFKMPENEEKYKSPFAMRDFARGRFKFGYVKRRHFNFDRKLSHLTCSVVTSRPMTINGWEEGMAWLRAEWKLEVEAAMNCEDADVPVPEDWRRFPAESKLGLGGNSTEDEEEESLD